MLKDLPMSESFAEEDWLTDFLSYPQFVCFFSFERHCCCYLLQKYFVVVVVVREWKKMKTDLVAIELM